MADKELKATARRRWTLDYIALWVVAGLSLVLNIFVLGQLAIARAALRQTIADTISAVDQFEHSTITTHVAIAQTVVIDTDLPVNQSIPVQIKDSFPIDTTVAVPVNAGPLGTMNLNIPIKTTIPVDVKPTITVNQTFHVKAPIPLKLDVPLQIEVASSGLGPSLDGIKARLQALGAQMDAGLLPPPATPVVQ